MPLNIKNGISAQNFAFLDKNIWTRFYDSQKFRVHIFPYGPSPSHTMMPLVVHAVLADVLTATMA